MQTTENPALIISREINARGAIPFDRFMELALYCPVCGYYEKEPDRIGRKGDFFTSVSVGPLFGRLLAARFAHWLRDLKQDAKLDTLHLVEAGAHRGLLMADVIEGLRDYAADLWDTLQFWIVEPSPAATALQQKALANRLANISNLPLRWVERVAPYTVADADAVGGEASPATLPLNLIGVIFSNELLDAMPVRRYGWDAHLQTWFEWGVTLEGARFAWTRLKPAATERAPQAPAVPEDLKPLLPDHYSMEVCPAAEHWWRQAAQTLARGKLMTIDYGFFGDEWLRPERPGGTLRAYRQHCVAEDVLANPGDQDITAHVNFSRIQSAGEIEGLNTDTLSSQEQFLIDILRAHWNGLERFWAADSVRQFQTLTHPEHLGRKFHVLVQSRGMKITTNSNIRGERDQASVLG